MSTEKALKAQLLSLSRASSRVKRQAETDLLWERVLRLSERNHCSWAEATQMVRRQLDDSRVLPPKTPLLCDAGLGGLARLLRAYGYPALWEPSIEDDALIEEAQQQAAHILTNDRRLMERGLIQRHILPATWVSPAMKRQEQLHFVIRELQLEQRPPCCMKCGGAFRPVDKKENILRIPPRTYWWLEDYFECENCRQLFWKGTHWKRISEILSACALPVADSEESSSDR